MVKWDAPGTLVAEGIAISKIDLVMLGMYVWECFGSSKFDYEVITGKRKWKWPMFVYFWSKYFTLWFIISINIMLQVTNPVNCMAMSTFIDFAGRTAIAAASNLLLLRSLALWRFDRRVLVPMVFLSLGQWAVLLHNMFITKEVWSTEQKTCVIVSVGDDWTKIQFIYTMCFDFIVLCLALTALLKLPGVSSLWRLLFFDGLAYFLVAFLCYLAATIMAALNFNGVSMFMVSDPATILANTAATRSFVRVLTYQEHIITLPSSDVGQSSNGSANGYRPGAYIAPWRKAWARPPGTALSSTGVPSAGQDLNGPVATDAAVRGARIDSFVPRSSYPLSPIATLQLDVGFTDDDPDKFTQSDIEAGNREKTGIAVPMEYHGQPPPLTPPAPVRHPSVYGTRGRNVAVTQSSP